MILSTQIIVGQDIIQISPKQMPRGTLSLSHIIESIEYIPLETNTRCLIGQIMRKEHLVISNNYILVYCNITHLCYLFSRAGKFVAQIGDRGNGPGEYINTHLFAIDEEKGQIILSTTTRYDAQLMFYDFKGKYLHSISVDRKLAEPIHPPFNDKYIVMHLNNPFVTGDPPFNYSIFSGDYKLITQKIKSIDYTTTQQGVGTSIGDYCYYLYDSQLHVKNTDLNDTIYTIDRHLSFYPQYIINTGIYSLTAQILSDPELFRKDVSNRVMLNSVFETNNYVLLSYLYNDNHLYQYYDKSLRSSMLFNTFGVFNDSFGLSSATGIPNDYDGGLNFWPKQQNGNEFITWYNAFLFEENENRLEPKGSKKSVENLKKVTREIIDIRAKLNTEANPVVVIVKFR